jgi:hypothetical protein
MQMLSVRPKPASANLYHLEIYRKNTHIGDFERSIEHEIKRKCEEVERSADFLIGIYMQHGRFVARWKSTEKEIRRYREGSSDPDRGAKLLGVIPRLYWQI